MSIIRYRTMMVTGASGFIGGHLLNYLAHAAHSPERIIALDRGTHHAAVISPRIQTVCCDLTDQAYLQDIIQQSKPDGIIHLAGVSSGRDLAAYFNNNLQACQNLLAAADRLQLCPRVMVVGSAAEYGITSGDHVCVNESYPLLSKTAYGISKTLQEQWALLYSREKSLPVICVRPFNIIGSGQSFNLVPATFMVQIAEVLQGRAREIRVGNVATQRDFIDVGDVVSAIWMLMNTNNKVDGEVFNISSGQPQKIAEILDACIALSGQKIPVVQDAERLKSYDIPVIIGDSSKLCAYTGWQCRIPLRKSLETMWAHITSGLQTSR